MNIEYFLSKRKSNLLEWLHDHRVYSLESFKATLQLQQLEVTQETLDLVRGLYSSEVQSIILQVPEQEPINSVVLELLPKKSKPKKSPVKEED